MNYIILGAASNSDKPEGGIFVYMNYKVNDVTDSIGCYIL